MGKITVSKNHRPTFRSIEETIESEGWDVTRQTVTDRHVEDGVKCLQTTLVLTRPIEEGGDV